MPKYILREPFTALKIEAGIITPHVHRWEATDSQPRDMSYGFILVNGQKNHVWFGDYVVYDPLGRPIGRIEPTLFESRYKRVD